MFIVNSKAPYLLNHILSGTTNNNNNYNNNGVGNNHNYNTNNNNNNNILNNNHRDQIPAEATKDTIPGNVHPILSGGGFPASPGNIDPFYRDAFQSDLKLPQFEPGYPAFFCLVLLVSLTTLSFFVLLFLCCIHPQETSKIPPSTSATPSTDDHTEEGPEFEEDEYEDDVEEVYIPSFIDAATSPFPDNMNDGDEEAVEESDDTVVIEAEEEDTIVIEAEDAVVIEAEAENEDTIVIEAEEAGATQAEDTVVIVADDTGVIEAEDG